MRYIKPVWNELFVGTKIGYAFVFFFVFLISTAVILTKADKVNAKLSIEPKPDVVVTSLDGPEIVTYDVKVKTTRELELELARLLLANKSGK